MAESGEVAVGGGRTLGEDSPEVKRIGALLRGEGDGGAREGKGEAALAAPGEAAAVEGELLAKPGATDGVPDDGAAPEGEEAAAGPLTVAELAKTLGVNTGELYKELLVPVDTGEEGERVSLEVLRKGYVGAKTLERERESFETDADRRSLEFMQARAELERLGELILPNAPREVVEKFQGVLLQREARERALLLEAVPEWKDAAKFAADRSSMIEFLKPWGFSAADVYAIGDHRIARFVRDMSREAKRKADAERKARERGNGEVKKGQAPDGRVSVSPLRVRLANIVKAGRAAQTPEAKTQAIGALLRGTQRGK